MFNNTFNEDVVDIHFISQMQKLSKVYLSRLKKHIKEYLIDNNPESYQDFFKYSRGAFPDLVYSIVKDLDKDDQVKRGFAGLLETNSTIPEPNPTNFDWRFDQTTIMDIVNLIGKKKYKKIALWGTPSLFLPITAIIKDVILYDVNEVLRNHFENDRRVIVTDINTFDFLNTDNFDCIIMDPPWYLNYYRVWLEKGSSILKINGDLYIPLFQDLLRPKAAVELKEIRAITSMIGGEELMKDFITYVTPQFEHELFNYKNIPCYVNWRIADFLVINKKRHIKVKNFGKIAEDKWTRIEIGTQTIAVKKTAVKSKELNVTFPFQNGDSLIKSVSNRDSVRKRINFYTSRNRGLIVSNPEKVISVLREIEGGVSYDKAFSQLGLTKDEVSEFEKILETVFI